MSPGAFTIALPGGRLAEESIEFFTRAGLATFDLPSDGRELSFFDHSGQFRMILVRSKDVPTYVLQGGADAGITGRDVLAEGDYDLTVPLELGYGQCRLALAAPEGQAGQLLRRQHLRVATKYPRLTMDYFFRRGYSCEVIKLHGSVEIAPLMNLADCIVDLVSTGATLRANGLVEIETILESCAVLVVSRSAYAIRTRAIRDMLFRFRTALGA
ncbi:MAG: ATP phosphoribosyltransferase [Spirochaetales bacterium]|nr:ATP phosphoribosyltransferase [Leptospiraceae bacterium]MCP5482753.1 ATP phosphoribosyltransferase [Spirochaetales bacterium]MCP5485247.1 ATP phosphoribosyltransferase [Spirochaetales bacterium]